MEYPLLANNEFITQSWIGGDFKRQEKKQDMKERAGHFNNRGDQQEPHELRWGV